MTIRKCCRFALTFALALFAPSLFAGEIVLFDGENFQGGSIAFRDTVPNLDGTGFNDRTASISVRDGTWEVCFDANFQGGCMQLQPGDYPRLDPPFNRSISSLREVGSAEYGGNYPAPAAPQSAAANEITLFEGENFEGNRITYGDMVSNLDGAGFNDRTASISVRGGTWEVCFDADFQGGCMQLQPGDYPRLDPPFNRSISSLRPLGGAAYGGNYPAPAPPPQVSLGIGLPGVSIGINLPSYPELVPVPGYPVYYAPQVNSNYFFYDGMYWAYQRDHWYASSWYNGPWGFVAPEAVPLFVLRVPVRYYRQPPTYFRGWGSDAPPRWGEHWGNAWAQSHRGWDNWNRNAVPAPAPLPAYQRQYSGNRYPAAAQQWALQNQNYRYQPQDAVVREHYQTQQGAAPVARGQPPQSGTRDVQRPAAPTPTQQSAAPVARGQPPQSRTRDVQRPAAPTPTQQSAAPVARGQPPQSGTRDVQRPAAPTPTQQSAAPVARGQPPQSGTRDVQRPAAPTPTQQSAAPVARGQPPQSGTRELQRPATPAPSHQGGPTAAQQLPQPGHAAQVPKSQGEDKGPQGKGREQEPKQGQGKDVEKGEQQGGERSR